MTGRRVETIIDAMSSRHLFRRWFKDEATWSAWRAFLAALFALPMGDEALATYKACTGRTTPPAAPFTEAWLVCGRRAGKSFCLALVAVFLACFRDWRPHLTPGETGIVMILARDRAQAKVIFGYVKALLMEVPVLAQYVLNVTSERIELAGQVALEIHTASYGALRGRTVIAGLCDELAFWDVEGANPDREILAALRPSMATVPGAMLLCASSPYARKGTLWKAFRAHWSKETPVLCWKAPTRVMNLTIDQAIIDAALEEDPAAAAAEWLAEFRSDVEGYVAREVVEALVLRERFELAPERDITYRGFLDPAGGSGQDSMTLAIGHNEGDKVVLDALRERRPPFSPEAVTVEFAELLRRYRVTTATGDRYAGAWPREQFAKSGIGYVPAAKTKSDLYRDLLPTLNSGQVELLDHPKLVNQICGLERRTARGGRDSIDHGPGAHDDIANVVAGVVSLCRKPVLVFI